MPAVLGHSGTVISNKTKYYYIIPEVWQTEGERDLGNNIVRVAALAPSPYSIEMTVVLYFIIFTHHHSLIHLQSRRTVGLWTLAIPVGLHTKFGSGLLGRAG